MYSPPRPQGPALHPDRPGCHAKGEIPGAAPLGENAQKRLHAESTWAAEGGAPAEPEAGRCMCWGESFSGAVLAAGGGPHGAPDLVDPPGPGQPPPTALPALGVAAPWGPLFARACPRLLPMAPAGVYLLFWTCM